MNTKLAKRCNDDGCERDHALHLCNDSVLLTVVRGGKRSYIHIEMAAPGRLAALSGVASLRRLAQCLLAELPPRRRS